MRRTLTIRETEYFDIVWKSPRSVENYRRLKPAATKQKGDFDEHTD